MLNFIRNNAANALTCANLFCGCYALHYATLGLFNNVFALVVIAGIFDFFDGFVARALKSTSLIGKDLDSLADMVTFGVVPAYTLYKIMEYNQSTQIVVWDIGPLAFMVAVFSAIRLANFNNDARQTTGFIGVPTPANALFIVALATMYHSGTYTAYLHNNHIIVGLVLLTSSWLLWELPLLALKFTSYDFASNSYKYLLIIACALCIITFGIVGVALSMLIYVALSIANNYTTNQH